MADFVKNVFVKKGKYGTKVSFKVDAFIEELKAKKNSEGYVNIEIKESKAGDKLYAAFDDWQPKPGGGGGKGSYNGGGNSGGGSRSPIPQQKDDGLPF